MVVFKIYLGLIEILKRYYLFIYLKKAFSRYKMFNRFRISQKNFFSYGIIIRI